MVPAVGQFAFEYQAQLTAEFLVPVRNVSFNTFEFRAVVYEYFGVNQSGETFYNFGGTGSVVSTGQGWHRISLDLPEGYHLTRFNMGNGDPINWDAAIWIDHISFDVIGVPDHAHTGVFLAVSWIGLLSMRKRLCSMPVMA